MSHLFQKQQWKKLSKAVISAGVYLQSAPTESLKCELHHRIDLTLKHEGFLCLHINQSQAMGCQGRDYNLPGRVAPGRDQFSTERGNSDSLTTKTHCSWRQGLPITSAIDYQISEEN